MDDLEEKLDRNFQSYQELVRIIQSIHSQPSPETIKAIQGLSEQIQKTTLILEQIVKMLTK